MVKNNNSNAVFFLGGRDAEMKTIREVLSAESIDYVDGGLGWGAKVSDYGNEIAEALLSGRKVVTIELINDLELEGIIEIDHHGDRSGEPAAILQVLTFLGMEPTRFHQLIAANDSGYIPAMLSLGATSEEIAEIRLIDRQMQGITSEQEMEAERALAAAEEMNGVTIIRMGHSKCAPVTDRLFDPEKAQNLLILSSDGESNYYGNGLLCQLLKGENTGKKTPEGYDIFSNFGGWNGGSGLGDAEGSGFWGGYGDQNAILEYVTGYFAK